MKYLPYILICVIFFLAAGFYVDYSTRNMGDSKKIEIQSPKTPTPSSETKLNNYGPAPELTGINNWINLPNDKTLTLKELKGKVILVDFWTYSCINCIRTLPYVTKWYDDYKDKGLVIIGVHTPEFQFEKITKNVENAIKQHNIKYPVAQDNDFATWNAYKNRYWPAKYLIDQSGNIVYTHFGEGDYDVTENAIIQLLGLDSASKIQNPTSGNVKSPEMYFGTSRLENLDSEIKPSVTPTQYNFKEDPDLIALNRFQIQGQWQFFPEKAVLTGTQGKIKLHFSSAKLFMVASAPKPITIKIKVDGKKQPDVLVEFSQLYTLFNSSDYSEHLVEIEIPESGFEAFTFTFG